MPWTNQKASTLDIKYWCLDLEPPCFKIYEQCISIVYNYPIYFATVFYSGLRKLDLRFDCQPLSSVYIIFSEILSETNYNMTGSFSMYFPPTHQTVSTDVAYSISYQKNTDSF